MRGLTVKACRVMFVLAAMLAGCSPPSTKASLAFTPIAVLKPTSTGTATMTQLPSPTRTPSPPPVPPLAIQPMPDLALWPTDVRVKVMGDSVEATFYLADVPAALQFQRKGVGINKLEYEWEVCVNTDNLQNTGMAAGLYSGMPGVDYCLAASSYKANKPPVTLPIDQGVQVNVWKLTQAQGNAVAFGTIHVDSAEQTITLSGKIPGITKNSIFYYMTLDNNPAGRLETSSGELPDRVQIQ